MPIEQRTPQQYLEALERHGGSRIQVAKEFNVGVRHVYKVLEICRKRGLPVTPPRSASVDELTETIDPLHNVAPEGFNTKGVSSYHGPEGELRGYWIKTNQDLEAQMRMLEEAAKALAVTIPPQPPIAAPTHTLEALANLYTITDYHVGMLAWRKEGGADWDLNIAETTLMRCFGHMIASAPPARVGIVNQLGDFLHTDGFQPLTPTSKHVLDADSRFPKIVDMAIRLSKFMLNEALTKHEIVIANIEEGNHDPASAVWLRAMFKALYANEPRIQILDSPLPYHAYQHGKCMLAFHHGHLKKIDKLPGFMAAQFPQMWGETDFRECHTGHLHHTHEKEDNGMTVVQHPTLAARDAFAARGGWHANRAAKMFTYHKDYGRMGGSVVTPEMFI